MDQYAGSPGRSTYSYAELAVCSLAVAETIASTIAPTHDRMAQHPLSTSSITAHHPVDLMLQKDNIGRCTNNPSGCHPIWTFGAPPPSSPIFMPNALSATTLPAMGQASNNAGLHTAYRWLDSNWRKSSSGLILSRYK